MKRIAFLTLLILSVFAFNSCKEQIAGTEFINYVSFEVNIPTIVVEQGGSTNMDIHVYTTKVTGSDRTFNVEVVQDTTVTTAKPESYTVPATVTVPANSNEGTLTVSASDNNLGQDPVDLVLELVNSDGVFTGNTASLTIQKHCTLDINDFVGTYSGETEGGWGPTQVVTSLDNNGNLQITGIGVSFLTGYWGEEITSMATLPVNVDLETGDFTIDQAAYITTNYEGAAQATYYLKAHGNLNACSGTMYLYYDFIQEGIGSYVDYFESQDDFTEIISIQ
jgi:hypothetical protein